MADLTPTDLPTHEDAVRAHERVAPHAHRTPVLTSRLTDAELGASLHFKCENFQRMGAFKFRGAFNALSRFSPEQRRAASSPTRPATTRRPWPCPPPSWKCPRPSSCRTTRPRPS